MHVRNRDEGRRDDDPEDEHRSVIERRSRSLVGDRDERQEERECAQYCESSARGASHLESNYTTASVADLAICSSAGRGMVALPHA